MGFEAFGAGTRSFSGSFLILVVFNTLLNFTQVSCQLISTSNNSHDNSGECDCYLTSGPTPGYFQYHRFWDFRDIASSAKTDYTTAPSLVTSTENVGLEPFTSPYLGSTTWRNDWSIQSYISNSTPKSPLKRVNSASNVYISRNTSGQSTYLTLRAHRLPELMSVSEVESEQKNLLHSSIRARIRMIPNGMSNASAPSASVPSWYEFVPGATAAPPVDPGAVMGFFTYANEANESDIEILTRDPVDRVRYTNQPSDNDEDSTDYILEPGRVWTDWIEHRMDWFADVSRWYVDNDLILNKTINVPMQPSGLIMNLWSDGGVWSGYMNVGVQATVAIEWIEMVFNVSGPLEGSQNRDVRNLERACAKKCKIACRVDGLTKVGFPEVVFNSTSAAASTFHLTGTCMPSVLMIALLVGAWTLYM